MQSLLKRGSSLAVRRLANMGAVRGFAKEIKFGLEGRAAMLKGVDILADAVQVRERNLEFQHFLYFRCYYFSYIESTNFETMSFKHSTNKAKIVFCGSEIRNQRRTFVERGLS